MLFLDADDYLYPNAASKLLAAWRPGVAMIQGLLDIVTGEGVRTGQFPVTQPRWNAVILPPR